ncbi:hypothetical protein HRG_013819 [Hirsutella rhossiliensis]
MIKNFAQDMAKMKVGKNWPYSFVNRHRNELGCTWFDGFDVARKRADSASKYRDYFELKLRSKIEEYDIAPCNTNLPLENYDGLSTKLSCSDMRTRDSIISLTVRILTLLRSSARKKWLKLE